MAALWHADGKFPLGDAADLRRPTRARPASADRAGIVGSQQVIPIADGTCISTGVVYRSYPGAWCPSPSGTFQRSSNACVDFYGSDGISHSYRFSGLVSSPDTITSYFGSRTNSPLVMKKGAVFNCTDWTLPRTLTAASPLAEYDATTCHCYLAGSHEPVTVSSVAETAPNYFRTGSCNSLLLPTHVRLVDDPEYGNHYRTRKERVIVMMTDSIGGPAHGVSGTEQFGDTPSVPSAAATPLIRRHAGWGPTAALRTSRRARHSASRS